MFITRPAMMANIIKPEETDWQGYSLHTPISATSHPPIFEANYAPGPGPMALPFHARQQKGSFRSLDIPSMSRTLPPRDGNGIHSTSLHGHSSQHSFPSLKRSFTEDSAAYGEIVQDFREEGLEASKPSINQDHRLLSFSKLPEKRVVVDNHGRAHQLELTAQIHGMFFLSEMTTPGSGGTIVQPELTCYRRNLFQISGTFKTPRSPLLVMGERGERIPIKSMEVTISASESVDGHAVKLIVIPWKTPPPNSPEVAGPGQEHEPAPLPIQPYDEEGPDTSSDYSVHPVAYRRLQFRIATANNGRRRELQQHFTLHLNVVATLANGAKTNICETSTAPIVVRGRSPRNFQARKEIPLVGSSSSRGGPPELRVSTTVVPGHMPTSAPGGKTNSLKPTTMETPRTSFKFDPTSLTESPAIMRTHTYPTYHSTAPSTSSYQVQAGMDNYLHVQNPSSDMPNSNSPNSIPRSQPQRQYSYQPTSSPAQATTPLRFIDSNPRPTKSPRHEAAAQLPQTSYPDYGTRFSSQYNGSDLLPPREPGYFPSSMPLQQSWSAASEATSGVYGPPLQAPTSILQQQQHQYQFSNEPYVKEENNQQQQQQQGNYTWSPS